MKRIIELTVIAMVFTLLIPQQTSAQNVVTLHQFQLSDGGSPGPLIQGNDGKLYGDTSNGGTNDSGIVYCVNSDGSGFTNLHTFSAVLGYVDGSPTNIEGFVGNPAKPSSDAQGLVQGTDGPLYGTAARGGIYGHGTIFSLITNGSGFVVLHTFAATVLGMNLDGASPNRLCFASDGKLYGTTEGGGTNGVGVVFRLDTDGNNFEVIYAFNDATTDDPVGGNDPPPGGLIQGIDGRLYGTTIGGNGGGTIFSLNPDGSNFTYLRVLTNSGTSFRLLQGTDGLLYGTTSDGGSFTFGTVFVMTTNGTQFSVLHSFRGDTNDPASAPFGGLLQASDGKLYGQASGGNCIFSLNTDGTDYNIMNVVKGNLEQASSLIQGGDGAIYGSDSTDVSTSYGTIFKFPVSLQIAQTSGNNVVVTWPTWASGYYALQTNNSLSATGWSALTNGIVTVTNNFALTNTMTGNAGFFRLH